MELAYYPRYKCMAKHKQAQEPKRPTWQPHKRRECSPCSSDTSSIHGYFLSTNRTQARGSMDPHGSHTQGGNLASTFPWMKGPRVNHTAKGEVGGPQGQAGRPRRSADGPCAPPPSILHVASPHWLLMAVPGGRGHGSLLYIQGEGVRIEHTTHTTHITHLQV